MSDLHRNEAESNEPIRIGISACLLGQKVRFDGGHKHDRSLERLGPFLLAVTTALLAIVLGNARIIATTHVLMEETGVAGLAAAATLALFAPDGTPVALAAAVWGAGGPATVTVDEDTQSASFTIASAVADAVDTALTPHRGPVFVDFPLDVLFDQVGIGIGNQPLQQF